MTEPEDHGRVNVANWNGKYPKGAGSTVHRGDAGAHIVAPDPSRLHRKFGGTVTDAWLMTSTARRSGLYRVNLGLGFGHAHHQDFNSN